MNKRQFIIEKSFDRELFNDALEFAFFSRVDKLDGKPIREPIDTPIKEIMDLCLRDTKRHMTFIERDERDYGGLLYFEVGLSTMGIKPEYFVWINISIENGEKLIKKYSLKQR